MSRLATRPDRRPLVAGPRTPGSRPPGSHTAGPSTTDLETTDLKIAVLVPCFDEAASIARVVADFRAALPDAWVYVYDNNSTDGTAAEAAAAGAVVRPAPRQGKGHVVRRMFSDVEADLYVLVDGDATYDAPSVRAMAARLVDERLDMVVAARLEDGAGAYRTGHRFGNRLLTGFVRSMFGAPFTDMLSGYRVFSRRFVKSFPVLSGGFEIETELTVHALQLDMPVAEIPTPYYARPEGSASKLNTFRDGFRILWTIAKLFRNERPLLFFGASGAVLALVALALALPLFVTYAETGLVPRFPTAILSTGLMILACLSTACGFVLDTVTRGRREVKLLAYLVHPGPGAGPAGRGEGES